MRYKFKYNKDFVGTNPETISGPQTTWDSAIHVELSTDIETNEKTMNICLGTGSKTLAQRRVRELLKAMENEYGKSSN